MKLDVVGKILEVVRKDDQWVIYRLGQGTKTLWTDIVIPSEYSEAEVLQYFEDMFHEAATPQDSKVKVIG